ncbi:GRAM domain-containing protein [Fennellomyces sp. T-0311]|nr:GRAM domain-containing protein [Fennellomyces sp. T-0311]
MIAVQSDMSGPSPTTASTSTPVLSRKYLPVPSTPQSRRSSLSNSSVDLSKGDYKMASHKRNTEFHALFRSVPDTDRLLDDYGCALQKEILIQGRMYISESHICFNANIFGWVTNLVIDFADIIEIEKRTTAIFIPNAIQISTTQAKYFFASFLSRDQAYDQISSLWRESQRRASANSDITKVDDDALTDDTMSSLSCDSESDRDTLLPPPAFSLPPTPAECGYERQNSLATLPSAPRRHPPLDRRRTASESQLSAKKDQQQQEAATGCGCHHTGGHYTHTVMDQMYQGSIEKIHNLLSNRAFLQKFLTEIEKNTDVDIGPWQKGETVHLERAITYIKPLSNAIGPRSTKCILKEQVHHMDVENYVTQVITTQTPDVPSGSSFSVKTRVCIMRAGQGKVRVLVTMIVEFTKSSWLKSKIYIAATIEKASIDGQISYYKGLDNAIRKYMQPQQQQQQQPPPPLPNKPRRRRRRPSIQVVVPKSRYDALMENVSAGAEWMQKRTVSTQQLMVLCMVLLVLINMYIATKMENVSRRLYMPEANESRPMIGLNRQILEIERMIQQAGESIDQVSKAVQQQQRMMIQDESI